MMLCQNYILFILFLALAAANLILQVHDILLKLTVWIRLVFIGKITEQSAFVLSSKEIQILEDLISEAILRMLAPFITNILSHV